MKSFVELMWFFDNLAHDSLELCAQSRAMKIYYKLDFWTIDLLSMERLIAPPMRKYCAFYRHINRALPFILTTNTFLFETFFTSQNWHQMHSTRKPTTTTTTTTGNYLAWKLVSMTISWSFKTLHFIFFSLVLFFFYVAYNFIYVNCFIIQYSSSSSVW